MTNFFGNSVAKLWLISIFESLLIFFSPIFALVFLVGFIALVDTFFGVWAAMKSKNFTSKKMRVGFMPKVFGYSAAIFIVYAIDKHILNEIITTFLNIQFVSTKVTSLVFITIETKSIDENYKRIYGYSMVDKIRKILKKLKTVRDEIKS